MIIDNGIRLDREKAVFLNVIAGSFKTYFVNDSELSTNLIRHVKIITNDDYCPPAPPITFAPITALDQYVVNFVDHNNITIIENMPILNLLPFIPYTTIAFEELPQFNFKFDPQKSFISTADGSSFAQNATIFFSFIFKD
jgi:hypothetical protein